MVLSFIHGVRGSSAGIAEVSRLRPTSSVLARSFRDASGPEARGDNGSEGQCLVPDGHKQPSGRTERGAPGALGSSTTPASSYPGPVRAAQRKKGERRKVLPVLGGDTFTSNVATLLLRWPHAPPSRQPRNWQDVCATECFRSLFPLRPTPLTERAVPGLKALVASGADMADGVGGPPTAAWSPGFAPYDAHQAALLELVERLQAVQQHLQDSMADGDGGGGGTIVALAAFTQSADNADGGPEDEDPSASHPQQDLRGAAQAQRFPRSSDFSGDDVATDAATCRSGCGDAPFPLGRFRRRAPTGWQRGPKPAPPWDDTQPFQTHVGTVYHFWRLCPYG